MSFLSRIEPNRKGLSGSCSKDSDEELLNPRTYAGKLHDRVTAVEWFKEKHPEEYAELAKDLDGDHDYK